MAIKKEILEPFNEHFGVNTFVRLKRKIVVLNAEFRMYKSDYPLLIVSIEEYKSESYYSARGFMCVNFIDANFVTYKSGFFQSFEEFLDFFECF